MIKELNSYVALKKQYASNLENKRVELFEGPGEGFAEDIVLLASFIPNQQLLDHGNKVMDETDQVIERSEKPVGTYGYAAPEYISEGHLSTRSDIYSFGVVLYEILTGRRTFDRNHPKMEQKLLEWVKRHPADCRKFSMIIDPRLLNQYSLNAARRIAKLADSCLNKNARERPTITHVVEVLQQAIQDSEEESSLNTIGPESSSSRSNPGATNKQFNKMGINTTMRQMSHAAQA